MSITTKKGDAGRTELLFGRTVAKGEPQVRALGAVDELNAFLGFARILSGEEGIDDLQKLLVTLMGELAMPEGAEAEFVKAGFGRIGEAEVKWIEEKIAAAEKTGPGRGWLRPGADGEELRARFHLARTVARRAELAVWEIPEPVASVKLKVFLNRVSDWMWLLSASGD